MSVPNRTCLIIGDGSSLRWLKPHVFRSYPIITLGYYPILSSFNTTYPQPYVAVLSDPKFFMPFFKSPYSNSIITFHSKSLYLSATKHLPHLYVHPYSRFFLRSKQNISFINSLSSSPFNVHLSSRNIDPYHGSIRNAISLSIYLGFEQVVLLGCDYTYSPPISGHWYEASYNREPIQNYSSNDAFFAEALKFIDISVLCPPRLVSAFLPAFTPINPDIWHSTPLSPIELLPLKVLHSINHFPTLML